MPNRERPAPPGQQQKPPRTPRLTRQQAVFVELLAANPKITQTDAAIEAGYSPKTAKGTASELLNDPKYGYVQDALAELTRKRLDKYAITPEKTLAHLAYIGYGDRRRLGSWGPDGFEPTASDELFHDEACLLQGISVEDTKYGRRIKVKFENRTEALHLLGKKDKLFIDKAEIDLKLGDAYAELEKLMTKLATNLEAGEQLRRELGL